MPTVPVVGDTLSLSNSSLESRSVPKLDGSGPAFIALVVVLAVVAVVSSAGILYMILDSRDKYDKTTRIYRYKSAEAEGRGWVARAGRIFGSRKVVPSHRKAPSEQDMMQGWAQSVQNMPSTRDILATIREEQPEQQPSDAYSTTDRTSTIAPSTMSPAVSFVDGSHRLQRPVPSRTRVYAPSHLSEGSIRSMSIASYRSRRDSSGTHVQPSIPSIAEHLVLPSPPSSSPCGSPAPLLGTRFSSQEYIDSIYPNGKGRPFATQSGTSITLEGGTKFLEEL